MSPDGPAPSPSDLAPQDVVLRFLESTGRPSEARLYLELFRARPREQFAALAIDANVMAGAADAVVQDLRFLAALDLFPTVVLGIFQPADAAAHARVLTRHLEAEGVAVETLSASEPGLARRLTAAAAAGRVPAVVFEPAAVSRQRYVVTPRQHLRQWRQTGRADVAFARKHPARAADLFAAH
ncbi:MAG TPA: hypothetical protein PLB01_13375, partial [Thermoanaerobaculia bacterium]|nr:hypothetical protein [Thermoanaerobaculia bacterium]